MKEKLDSYALTSELVSALREVQFAKGWNRQDTNAYTVGYLETQLTQACERSPEVYKDVLRALEYIRNNRD
jgi:hypothetical protein